MASATDHLANERTFLAYLRTALAFVGFGFVIARFGVFVREFQIAAHTTPHGAALSTPLGIVMVSAGVLTAIFGYSRFKSVAHALERGESPALGERSALIIVSLLALFSLIIVYEISRV